jgi:hypothetical protein
MGANHHKQTNVTVGDRNVEAAQAEPLPSVVDKPKAPATATLSQKLKMCDMAIKGLGGLVLVIGAVYGYLDYRGKEYDRHIAEDQYREKKDAEEQAEREQQKRKSEEALAQQKKEFLLKLYEERRPLFMQACRHAAQIATADTLADAKPVIKKFLELYYGELCLVETPEVEKAMIDFKEQLMRHGNETFAPSRELRIAALKLAMAAQTGLNLAEVFDVKLGDQSRKLGGEQKLEKR